MSNYATPGVYFEEISIGAKPVEGVSTSVAAFIGVAAKGPVKEPVLVTSWQQYEDSFGGIIRNRDIYLGYAVDSFFRNGGKQAYIVRVATPSLTRANRTLGSIAFAACESGASGNRISIDIDPTASITGVQQVFKAAGALLESASGARVRLNNDGGFEVGDQIKLTKGAVSDTVTITEIDASGRVLTVAPELGAHAYSSADTLESADPVLGTTALRLEDASQFCVGSLILIKQGAKQETAEVKAFAGNKLILKAGLTQGYSLAAATTDPLQVSSQEFDLKVTHLDEKVNEAFAKLSMNVDHPRYFASMVKSALVEVSHTDRTVKTLPPLTTAALLQGGNDEDLEGTPDYSSGLEPLTRVEGISILAIPGQSSRSVHEDMISHCQNMKYRFAVLDCGPKLGFQEVLQQRQADNYDTNRAALYYPWIQINDPVLKKTVAIPPSGAVAGIYARSDSERGVHKAPANEVVAGAVGVERIVSAEEQGLLNPAGINVIRSLTGRGIRVWGARTLSSDPEWKYINIRRLFIYLEESIDRATQWVVFEPNNERLWARVRATVSEFLTRVWRDGALMGTKAEEAFFVKCDRTTMTQSDIDNGYLIVMIGVAPVKPAEFVVFKIAQVAGGSST